MRASGINAFAAPVGQSGRAIAPEQGRQPTGQITADHIAIMRIGRPACDQMRKDRRASGKAALQGIFQIEQAQIIFAPLAHDDLGLERLMVGVNALCLAHQLPLQRLGKGGNPHGAIGGGGPQAGRRQITQRLANARACFGQHHMRFALALARRENIGRHLGKIALTLPRFGRAADERCQAVLHGICLQCHDAGRGARRSFLPFGQAAEQPTFGPLGLFECSQHQIGPWPTQPHQRLRRIPSALTFGPICCAQHRQQMMRGAK